MIRINLLPESKRPPLLPAGEYIFLAIAGTVFLLSMAAWAFNYCQILELDRQAAQIGQQQAMLQSTAAHMEKAGEKQREITKRAGLLLKLTDERSAWHTFLCHLSEVTPPQIWLTEAVLKNKDGDATASLKGRALTYGDIAVFLQKLEQDKYLRGATLIKAEKVDSFGGGQFEIAAQIKKL